MFNLNFLLDLHVGVSETDAREKYWWGLGSPETKLTSDGVAFC